MTTGYQAKAKPTHKGEICPYEPIIDISKIETIVLNSPPLELNRAPEGTVSYVVKPDYLNNETEARAMVFWNKGTSSWQMNVTGSYVTGPKHGESTILPFAHAGYDPNKSAKMLVLKTYENRDDLEEIARKSLEAGTVNGKPNSKASSNTFLGRARN